MKRFLFFELSRRTKEIFKGSSNHQMKQIGPAVGRLLEEKWRENRTLGVIISDVKRIF